MTQTYSHQLKQLNKEWKEFIEQEKLFILSKSQSEVIDFLLNLTFIRPIVEKEERDIDAGDHSFNVTFTDVTIEAEYTGNAELEQESKLIFGYYEYFNGGFTEPSLLIEATRVNPSDLNGTTFSEYLWNLDVDETADDCINEVIKQFNFFEKILALHRLDAEEKKVVRNKLIKEKYNNSFIKIVEEHGQSYIVLHDNTKVPFPINTFVKS